MEHCPVCGSESFAFVIRWVKSGDNAGPEKPTRPNRRPLPPERSEQLDAYRGLLEPDHSQSRLGRLVTGGALGLAIVGLARFAWRALPAAPEPSEPPRRSPRPGSSRD
jgi:hypothetical protein